MITSMDDVKGLAVALGIGLLIGIERERRKGEGPTRGSAGIRTFALIALAGAIAALLGQVALALAGGFTALAALGSWRRGALKDPGLTTEFAMLVVFLLGALAMDLTLLAAATGVLVALLLATKSRLHSFVNGVLTAQELHDALLLAVAAIVVLPLLPDRTIDPWSAVNPRDLWLLAVILMVVNAVGHIALRWLGASRGLLLAGLAGGFASSTATTAAMGGLARRSPEIAWPAACAALASSFSTVVQLAIVTSVVSPTLLALIGLPLCAAGFAILTFSTVAVLRARGHATSEPAHVSGRAFQPTHALLFTGVLAAVLLASAAAREYLGSTAGIAALTLAGFADAHAPAVSAGQLFVSGRMSAQEAAWAVALALTANSISKLVVAFATGGTRYAARLLPGLLLMVLAFVVTLWLTTAR